MFDSIQIYVMKKFDEEIWICIFQHLLQLDTRLHV